MIDAPNNNYVTVNLVSSAPLRREAIEGIVNATQCDVRFTVSCAAGELSYTDYRGTQCIAYPVHAALSKIAQMASDCRVIHLAVDTGKYIASAPGRKPVFFQRPKTLEEGKEQIAAVIEAMKFGNSVSVNGLVAKSREFTATAVSARPFRLMNGVDVAELQRQAIEKFSRYWQVFSVTGDNRDIRPGGLSLEDPIYVLHLAAGRVFTRMSNSLTPPNITDEEIRIHIDSGEFIPLSSYAGGSTHISTLKQNKHVRSITDEVQGAPQDYMVAMVLAVLHQMSLEKEFTHDDSSATMNA